MQRDANKQSAVEPAGFWNDHRIDEINQLQRSYDVNMQRSTTLGEESSLEESGPFEKRSVPDVAEEIGIVENPILMATKKYRGRRNSSQDPPVNFDIQELRKSVRKSGTFMPGTVTGDSRAQFLEFNGS